jgi:kumamolisin
VTTTVEERRSTRRLSAVVAVVAVMAASAVFTGCAPRARDAITGPYALLLASSDDLGPSHSGDAQVTVTLADAGQANRFIDWARGENLWVRWHSGDRWAVVEGAADDMAHAFDVPVHDYRGHKGQVFYASPLQPSVPPQLREVVTGVGRIMGYTPHRTASPDFLPLDVPKGGLRPQQLLDAYNATPLAEAGFTGKGATIVFFAFDKADQADLDAFADSSGLPRFAPVIVGGEPDESHGETAMDLQVAHAIAPDARLVVVNARPTVQGDGAYEKIGQMFAEADRRFPGAVWSLSIGWGCEALVNAVDLAPVEAALTAAQERGTSAFDASGDTGGMECQGGDDWSSPPSPDNVGLNSVAALPTMTSVGGTT